MNTDTGEVRDLTMADPLREREVEVGPEIAAIAREKMLGLSEKERSVFASKLRRLLAGVRLGRRSDVPRAQIKGPFTKGAKAYVICPYCTIEARLKDPTANLCGVAKQYFSTHLVSVHGIEAKVAAGVQP